MKRLFKPLLLVMAAAMTPVSGVMAAELRVFACEPEWAALAGEIGGERVVATSATHAGQDVHYIQARPSLISQLRRADLLVCTGAGLEVGWLPVLLQRANNAAVQPGTPGYLIAADVVPMLDIPTSVDRSQGDMHPEGNPHLQLDPRNIARMARALTERLVALDPAGAATYRARLGEFEARWQAALTAWEARAVNLRGLRVVAHHADWRYLEAWLGLEIIGKLEPLPGVPPTSAHLAGLLKTVEGAPVAGILRTEYQDARAGEWLAERTGAPVLMLPHTVDPEGEAADLFKLFDVILARLESVSR